MPGTTHTTRCSPYKPDRMATRAVMGAIVGVFQHNMTTFPLIFWPFNFQ